VTINPNIAGWGRVVFFGAGAAYLWRSAFFPKKNEPQGMIDRSIRVTGAVILSAVTLYFVGYGFGLYGTP
jgi:hypothetical protein